MYNIQCMIQNSNVLCDLHKDTKYNKVEGEGPQIILKSDTPM